MALTKRIKVGGSYYKGYKCTVGAGPGDHTLVIAPGRNGAINSISVTPDGYGIGDTMSLKHYSDASATEDILAILAEDIYNAGKGATVSLDLPAAEKVNSDESLLFTYTNVAGVAMNVYIIVEFVGIRKTS